MASTISMFPLPGERDGGNKRPVAKLYKRKWFNKKRLYVALYRPQPNPPRVSAAQLAATIPAGEDPHERDYHWCFLIGPKEERHAVEPGIRIEVLRDDDGDWYLQRRYEENVRNTGDDMWVRMCVGKIKNLYQFYNMVYGVPTILPHDPAYRNKTWVLDCLDCLRMTRLGIMSASSRLDRAMVEAMILYFVNQKITTGRFNHQWIDQVMNVPKPM